MKGRHQFRRRFSLQPSFLKEEHEEERRPHRTERTEETVSSSANLTNNAARHKIVVLGAAKVGKSSLITQFLYNTFSTKYKRTIEEMHHGDFNVAGVRLTLDILDTSGAYEFPAMRALSMQSADAFILVYDITDPDSFAEVRTLRDQIHETKASTAVPIVVVGNKVDLAETGARQVDFHTTESVVTVDWENGFVEASAKDNVNVSQIFKELLVQAKLTKRSKQRVNVQDMSAGSCGGDITCRIEAPFKTLGTAGGSARGSARAAAAAGGHLLRSPRSMRPLPCTDTSFLRSSLYTLTTQHDNANHPSFPYPICNSSDSHPQSSDSNNSDRPR